MGAQTRRKIRYEQDHYRAALNSLRTGATLEGSGRRVRANYDPENRVRTRLPAGGEWIRKFSSAMPPPSVWVPSFDGESWLLEPAQQLYMFAETDDCADDTVAPPVGLNSAKASKPLLISRGTGSSNPFPPSGESLANLTSSGCWSKRTLGWRSTNGAIVTNFGAVSVGGNVLIQNCSEVDC
jgi:hypothetical protein